ncbi:hypothetical protein R6Q59_002556 [Mikania micrantha]
MSTSSSSKKLHHFDMPDDLNWSNQVRNQRLIRRALSGPSMSIQPQTMLHNDSTSTHDEKPKPATVEPKQADKRRPNASTSTFQMKDEELVSSNRMLEPQEKSEDKQCKPKLNIALTREEIEDDYFGMTGRKLPRNMMKRDKTIQNDLDALFPALSLEGQKIDNLPKRY